MTELPGLAWFDPLKYQRAESGLPADDPREIEISRSAQASRTPAGIKNAEAITTHWHTTGWYDEAGKLQDKLGFVDGLFVDIYLKAAMGFNSLRTMFEKKTHGEKRPFQVVNDLHYAGERPNGSSFPSGHSSTAFTAAEVLARANPGGAERYFGKAADVARTRIYLGDHFAGDTAAGAHLGVDDAGVIPWVLPTTFLGLGGLALAGSRLVQGHLRTGLSIGAGVLGGVGALIAVMELRNGLFLPADHAGSSA